MGHKSELVWDLYIVQLPSRFHSRDTANNQSTQKQQNTQKKHKHQKHKEERLSKTATDTIAGCTLTSSYATSSSKLVHQHGFVTCLNLVRVIGSHPFLSKYPKRNIMILAALSLFVAISMLPSGSTGEAPFCAPAFSYVVRTKKGPLLCHTCTWFVTRKAPCYLAVTWERRRTKILKGLCGVIGWFQVAADIGLPLK